MATIFIKLAGQQDREALCRLYFEFHEFHVRGVPDRLVSLGKPLEAYAGSELYLTLEKIIDDDNAAIFMAQAGVQPVGLAEVYLQRDEPSPLKVSRRYGLLQSLMVREGFRQQGIGTRLLEAAQEWARAKDASEMRLETWEFEAGPLAFYEKQSYRTLRRTLVRDL